MQVFNAWRVIEKQEQALHGHFSTYEDDGLSLANVALLSLSGSWPACREMLEGLKWILQPKLLPRLVKVFGILVLQAYGPVTASSRPRSGSDRLVDVRTWLLWAGRTPDSACVVPVAIGASWQRLSRAHSV